MLYITALALTKISILFFYLKVFPKRSFRLCTYALIAINLVYAITYDLLLIFQCNPIKGAWLQWDGEFETQCISINVLGWSAAAINIALDLAVIILPLPELFALSLSLRKRLQIIAMFTVGFLYAIPLRIHSKRHALIYCTALQSSASSVLTPSSDLVTLKTSRVSASPARNLPVLPGGNPNPTH